MQHWQRFLDTPATNSTVILAGLILGLVWSFVHMTLLARLDELRRELAAIAESQTSLGNTAALIVHRLSEQNEKNRAGLNVHPV
jgi:hypothetical protein